MEGQIIISMRLVGHKQWEHEMWEWFISLSKDYNFLLSGQYGYRHKSSAKRAARIAAEQMDIELIQGKRVNTPS